MNVDMVIASELDLRYEQAFEQHWADVFRFSLAWTNDWAAAEDLAQDAYLRLWQHRLDLDWDRPALPWLLVAARRLATDRFRSMRRRMLPRSDDSSIDEAVSPTDVAPISAWLAGTYGASIDLGHAVLVEVDYPALAGNNAGYDLFIVNQQLNGLYIRIYDVR